MILNKLPKTRTSNPISKLFRPMFEKKRIKAALGGVISMTTLASGIFLMPPEATLASTSFQPNPIEVELDTQKSFANVLPANTGISQGYHWGHPGMDITAHLGSDIYPLKAGKVIKMENLKWDYGRDVYIDHGNGMVTLYAHMGKIFVQEGDEVTTDTPIGEVGVTGRTTGPHLHFEVRIDGTNVNPQPYLALGQK